MKIQYRDDAVRLIGESRLQHLEKEYIKHIEHRSSVHGDCYCYVVHAENRRAVVVGPFTMFIYGYMAACEFLTKIES